MQIITKHKFLHHYTTINTLKCANVKGRLIASEFAISHIIPTLLKVEIIISIVLFFELMFKVALFSIIEIGIELEFPIVLLFIAVKDEGLGTQAVKKGLKEIREQGSMKIHEWLKLKLEQVRIRYIVSLRSMGRNLSFLYRRLKRRRKLQRLLSRSTKQILLPRSLYVNGP